MSEHAVYLGDAVYASFDGYHIWLHLGRHDAPPLIALEPQVLAALNAYAAYLAETYAKEEKAE
jgi:hypothetical protein